MTHDPQRSPGDPDLDGHNDALPARPRDHAIMAWALKRTALGFGAWALASIVLLGPLRGPLSTVVMGDTTLADWLAGTGLVAGYVGVLGVVMAMIARRVRQR